MHSRIISGLLLLSLGLATSAAAASLADAAEQRDQAGVHTLLETGGDVNLAQVDGTTALHWAAFHDDAELVALLLRTGADVNTANLYGVPPLAQACINGNAAIVKLLLEAGADANAALKGGETVLMLAARSGNAEAVQNLLGHGANPNSSERLGQTVLMWAAAEGHTVVVHALIQAGADINARVDSGFTPFFFAVREGRLDVVKQFLAAGVDVNAMLQPAEGDLDLATYRRRRRVQVSPLLLAVQNAHFELALALVDAGADPNDVRTGFTPLHVIPGVRKPDSSDISDGAPPRGAGSLSSTDFVREIVKRGADVNFRLAEGTRRLPHTSTQIETAGATPLLFAADRADVPQMHLLLELGADPLMPNFNGTTPFLAAAGLGTQEPQEEAGVEAEALEAVQLMLDHGADVNAVNNDGDTAMHGAAYNMYARVIELLAERGADPQVWKNADKFGRTPLFIAEGHSGRLQRPYAPTIATVTTLMLEAGLSLEGKRPEIIDIYQKTEEPPKPAEPTK
jgi:ankyrin repeat protein